MQTFQEMIQNKNEQVQIYQPGGTHQGILIRGFLNLLYPPVCPFCGEISQNGICPACRKKIVPVGRRVLHALRKAAER